MSIRSLPALGSRSECQASRKSYSSRVIERWSNVPCLTWCYDFPVTDIPISPITIRTPGRTLKTLEFVLIITESHEGTNVRYHWKLENEDLTKTSRAFWHVFNEPGIHPVHVTAYNRNTTVQSSAIFVVQDEIKGLKCHKDTVAVVPMEEAVIEWTILKGTLFHFWYLLDLAASILIISQAQNPIQARARLFDNFTTVQINL